MNAKWVIIISDQDKGLQSAVLKVFPDTHHLYYCQYLTNIQKHFELLVWNTFCKVAYIWNKHDFVCTVKEINMLVVEYINNIVCRIWIQYVTSTYYSA